MSHLSDLDGMMAFSKRLCSKLRLFGKHRYLIPVFFQELWWRLVERTVGSKRVTCPICNWQGRRFRAYASDEGLRRNALCDRCRMGSRERALYCHLSGEGLLRPGMRCLDFGRRLPYARLFEEQGCYLLSVDLVNDSADAKMDITGLALRNEAFDLVICYHVLEHVREDAVALEELHRVLRPTGTLIIQVPWFPHRDSTREYEGNHFGPDDHVREYGRDLIEKITTAGFRVALRNDTDGLDAEETKRYGIAAAVSFICSKKG